MSRVRKTSNPLPLSTLSALLTAIASAKDKTTLLKTIIAELQPQFSFHDVGLFIVNEEEDYHLDLATDLPEISPSDLNTELYEAASGRLSHQGSAVEWMMNEIDSAGEPVLFDFHKLTTSFPDYPQFKHFPDSYRDCLATTLQVQGELIGMFCINALEKNKLALVDRQLFQTVADQIAVALSSIMSREQLLEEKQLKETLLEISEAATQIRGREDLYRAVMEKIHPIIPYDDAVVIVLTEKGDKYKHVLTVSSQDRKDHPLYNQVMNRELPAEDSPFEEIIQADDGTHFRLENWLSRYPNHPGLKLMKDTKLHHSVVFKLRQGGRVFGVLLFHFQDEPSLNDSHRKLHSSIADQLSVAVSNVLANENLVAEKNMTESLLKITEAATNISSLEALHQQLISIIKPLVAYDDTVVIIYDENYQYGTHILTDASPERKQHRFYRKLVDQYIAVKDTPIQDLITDEQIRFIDIREEWLPKYQRFPGAILMLETGLFYTVGLRLSSGGKQYGSLLFHFKEKPTLDQAKKELFGTIASQFSIAISDILSQESLVQEKEFKETLLSISEAATQIRDRKDLHRAVLKKIHPIVQYDDAVVVVLSKDQSAVNHVLTMSPEERVDHPLYSEVVEQSLPIGNSPFEEILKQPDVAQYHLQDLLRRYPAHPGVRMMQETGLADSVALKLYSEGELFGFLVFHFNEIQVSYEQNKPLYLGIADQLAVAVSNVLANERLLKEKQFKETLLDISEALTRIRDRKDLLKILKEKIQPIVGYDDAAVATFSDNYTLMTNVLIISAEERKRHPSYQEAVNEPLVIEQGLPKEFLEQKDVSHHSLEEMLMYWPDSPGLHLMKETGLVDSIVLKLRSGDEVFGLLTFHFTTFQTPSERDESLYLSVADQLAVAVKNVLSNESLVEEKKFKETLLTISEATTRIRNREHFFKVVTRKIKPFIPFDDVVVVLLTDQGRKHNHILSVSPQDRKDHPLFDQIVDQELPTEGSPFEEIMQADDGAHFRLEDWLSRYPSYPSVKLMKDTKLHHSIALKLRRDRKVFGMLLFHFRNEPRLNDSSQRLYANIADQMSITVSNILANERIRQREREKSLQVEVIDALNQGRNWKDKLEKAAQRLERQIPFSMISFAASQHSESFPNYGFEKIGPGEYRTLMLDDLYRMSDVNAESLKTSLAQRSYREVTIVDTETFRQRIQENVLERAIWEVFGVRSLLVMPITLKKEEGMYVIFYSQQPDYFKPNHVQLLNNIQSSFELAIEKHLNYEKIQELNVRLAQEKSYLEEEIKTHYNFGQIVGESSALQEVFVQVNRVAPTDATVLIQGETGTGKELAARALHESSPRSKQSLIKVNCAALPPQLIESELFGHEKGAFTGAAQRRIGKFELANNGSIFLDEIGELPLELQGKLLRVLQEKEFERLGSNQLRRLDVRIITATNRDLKKEIQEGRFRQDLYFRLNVFPIQLPPLRERSEDIPLLARFFMQKYASKFKKQLPPLTKTQLEELSNYSWPGNVRELEHIVERAVIQANGQIGALNLPLRDSLPRPAKPTRKSDEAYTPKSWKETEVEVLINTLRYCDGKVRGEGGAAQLLGLHPNTLESRMKKLGIKRQHIIS